MTLKEHTTAAAQETKAVLAMADQKERKRIRAQLILFLLLCLPVTWALNGISFLIGGEGGAAMPAAQAVTLLACFIPAIAAVAGSKMTKESIRGLHFLPRFQQNGKTYAFAVLISAAISILDVPLVLLLFFPSVGRIRAGLTAPEMVFSVLLYTALGCVQFWVLMGEEIGWMGYLFPRLEKLCGTGAAIVITGLIRGCWHIAILLQADGFLKNLITLCVTNMIGGCLLVLLTKKSGSVVPAAVCHALNNTLPAVLLSFLVIDEQLYREHELVISVLGNIPYVIVMIICFRILMKKHG